MSAPTLYFLEIRHNESRKTYDVYESHCGQEKGCFWTEPAFLEEFKSRDEVEDFIRDYEINPPLAGRLSGVEWVED